MKKVHKRIWLLLFKSIKNDKIVIDFVKKVFGIKNLETRSVSVPDETNTNFYFFLGGFAVNIKLDTSSRKANRIC